MLLIGRETYDSFAGAWPEREAAGGEDALQPLLAAGLVDELRLLVHPVAARSGRRLFDDGDTAYHLAVLAAEVFPTGVIRVIYAPAAAPGAAGYDDVKDQLPAAQA